MLTAKDRKARYTVLEATAKRRRDNVRKLCETYTSWTDLGRACGQSVSFLTQIAGPNPTRAIGEALARNLESALKLPPGWLDERH